MDSLRSPIMWNVISVLVSISLSDIEPLLVMVEADRTVVLGELILTCCVACLSVCVVLPFLVFLSFLQTIKVMYTTCISFLMQEPNA